MLHRFVLLAVALGALLAVPSAGFAAVGPTDPGNAVDYNVPGRAQDYRVSAATSETVDRLNVWLDPQTTGHVAKLGLYADDPSRSLLGSCTIQPPLLFEGSPRRNSCLLPSPVDVTAGAQYWLAILQPESDTGAIKYRNTQGVGRTYGSDSDELEALSDPWVDGPDWGEQTASIYADTAPASANQFPNKSTTGVPAGWQPAETRSTNLVVSTPGAVVEDVLLTNSANIRVTAPNVTIRRVKLEGGAISNYTGNGCAANMVVDQASLLLPAGQAQRSADQFIFDSGEYTAKRIYMERATDGFRVQSADEGCTGTSTIADSYVDIYPPEPCGDWHGDGVQGWNGGPLVVNNVTIDMSEIGWCGGTSPFFWPNQGNGRADVNHLLVAGKAGFMFRLGRPGTVKDLAIEDNSWYYGPIDNACELITSWSARIVTVNRPDYRVATVRPQDCNTFGGGQ